MTYHAQIGDDGTFAVPDGVWRALGLKPGDRVAVEQEGWTLHLRLEEPDPLDGLRAVLSGYSVDEFLRDRNADWGE